MPETEVPTLAVVIPTHGAFEYAAQAVDSLLASTRAARPVALVVDDASPGEETGFFDRFAPLARDHPGRVETHRFDERGGLLRSWNWGLARARDLGAEYAAAANSDLVFAPGWDGPLLAALDAGYDLVGPVTNAPGTEDGQHVRHHLEDPDRLPLRSGRAEDVALVAAALRAQAPPVPALPATLNGFCLVARTATWWGHAFDRDAGHVFRPRNELDSKGRPNPTPTMTLGEYELQRRWHAAGLRTGFCPGSYVFHYRSVSRGDKYKRGDWARIGAV